MTALTRDALRKVPAVTLAFWIIKIAATTLGETGGDAVSMSLNLGYALASVIFIAVFLVFVVGQISAKTYTPFLYWAVIIATTTAGTTIADFFDRSLGIGYLGGSLSLALLLVLSLVVWHRVTGTIAVDSVVSPRTESFYWVAILFSQTLGTALGDWMADSAGLGYMRASLVFGAGLAAIIFCQRFTRVSSTLLFWGAFVLTRPLGATLGDFLDKPLAKGGLNLDRFAASAVLATFIVMALLIQMHGARTGRKLDSAPVRRPPSKLMGYVLFGAKLMGASVLTFAIILVWRINTGNEGNVIPNVLYRSGQLTDRDLEREIRQHHIRTVINLRGTNEGSADYQMEVAVCQRLNIEHRDVSFSARHLPSPQELNRLEADFHSSPQPILLHCRAGSDRTGLAAAIFLIDRAHMPWKQAETTLSWQYGHFAIYPYFEMDELIELYGESHAISFSDWAAKDYPSVYAEEEKETAWDEFMEPLEYFFCGRV